MKNGSRVVITGATGAIGSALAEMLAALGVPMVFACRNTAKAQELKNKIIGKFAGDGCNIEILELDLASLHSVREFAAGLEKLLDGDKIAALVNNAGVIARGYSLTEDGWELNFGINYIAVWELTGLVRPLIKPGGRIVNVISCTTRVAVLEDDCLQCARKSEGTYNRLKRYSEAKLALLMATKEMARRFDGIYVAAADPGIVDSGMIAMGKWFDPLADIFFRPFIKSPEKGALPLFRALTDKDVSLGETWIYNGARGKKGLPGSVLNDGFSERLWNNTSRELGE